MAMPLLEDKRALWKIPVPPSCQRTASELDPSTFLGRSIGIPNPGVVDMSPSRFWKMFLQDFRNMRVPAESVVAIMGDLVRDKSDEKSLPWYESPYFGFVNNCIYFASLMQEFPFPTEESNVVVILRNELGNSLPIQLNVSNSRQFFTSIIREIGDGIPDISLSFWTRYVCVEKIKSKL
jgi:hypothetical protein